MSSLLNLELSKVDSISNIEEKNITKGNKNTTAFQMEFDYNKFPLSALEITDGDDGDRFINLRITVSYSKVKYPSEIDTLRMINDFNSKSICVKAFYIDGDDEGFDIAYNIEDVLSKGVEFTPEMVEKKIDMIVRAPIEIHKAMDGK